MWLSPLLYLSEIILKMIAKNDPASPPVFYIWYQTHGNFCYILIRLLVLVSGISQPS